MLLSEENTKINKNLKRFLVNTFNSLNVINKLIKDRKKSSNATK